ncbi:MAG: hypothetical protein U0Y82_04710 [Thermoleophilia bacterium]
MGWLTALVAAVTLDAVLPGVVAAGLAACITLALMPGARRAAAALGCALVCAAPAVAYSLLSGPLSADHSDSAARAVPGVIFACLLGAGMFGAVALLPSAHALAPHVPARSRPRLVVGVVAVLLAVSPFLAVFAGRGAITSCGASAVGNGPGRFENIDPNQRGAWWCQAIDGWRAHPLVGNGAGSFPAVQARWRTDGRRDLSALDPHQAFLGPLSDLGLAGLAGTLAVWAAAVWALLRLRRRMPVGVTALLAAAGVQVQTDWTLSWPASGLPVMAAVGMLVGTVAAAGAPRRRLGNGRDAVLAGALAAVAVLAVGGAYLPWRSTRVASDSESARTAGDLPHALRLANRAHRLDPLALGPYTQRALALNAGGRRAAATETMRQATRSQPDNAEAWRQLASLLGDTPAARLAWQRVQRLDPQAADAAAALAAAPTG